MKKLTFLLMICSFFAATSVFGQVLGTTNYGNFSVNPSSSNNNVSLGGFLGKFGVIGYANPNYRLHITSYTGTGSNLNGISIDASDKTGLLSEVTTGTAIWGKSTTGLAGYFEGRTQFNGQAEFISGDVLIQNGRLLLSNGANQIELKPDGLVHAREIEVDLDVIPDYVFEDDYNLMPLAELQKFIDLNHHLPNIKSAAEYEAYGSIPLKELNLKLLEKVEELTLYTLEQEQEIETSKAETKAIHNALIEINKEIKALKTENERLKQEIKSLK